MYRDRKRPLRHRQDRQDSTAGVERYSITSPGAFDIQGGPGKNRRFSRTWLTGYHQWDPGARQRR